MNAHNRTAWQRSYEMFLMTDPNESLGSARGKLKDIHVVDVEVIFYSNQIQHRRYLQVFIDRWRYNANRGRQAQSKIKVFDSLPNLVPTEQEAET